jgi:tryptophanyl-tRNA synthetase
MRKRIFSGFRPTGKQHIGNYLVAVQNFVTLQDEYDCVYCMLDIQALTTLESTESLCKYIYEMVLDWLASVLTPRT